MDKEETKELFEKHEEEFCKFNKIDPKDKISNRADICAFVLLDKLVPGNIDIVSAAEHDEIYLEVEEEDLAKVVTEDQIIFLSRCGVCYNDYEGCFAMFV